MAQYTNNPGAVILDRCTFERMYSQKQLFSKSVSLAMRFGCRKCDAEDIAGEARRKVIAGVQNGRCQVYEDDATSYVLRAVSRIFIDWKKRQSRRVQEISYNQKLQTQDVGDDSSCVAVDVFSDNADMFDSVALELVIDDCLKQLSKADAELIKFIDLNGMSQRDFSVYCGECEGTVRSRLSRARKKLRPILERAGIAPSST